MKMTDIMKKHHSESKSENLDILLKRIDTKDFITSTAANDAPADSRPQSVKIKNKTTGVIAVAACAAVAVGAFTFSGLLKSDVDSTPSTASSTSAPDTAPQTVTVPDVTNKTYAEAEMLIAQAGGTPIRRDMYSDTISEENVIETEPAAGSQLKANEEVTIFVSKGVPVDPNADSTTDSTVADLTDILERLTDLKNTNDLETILAALNAKADNFGIISAENCGSYINVVVSEDSTSTRIKAYLESYGVDPDLVAVYTPYNEPTESLPVSDTAITNAYAVSNLVKKLSDMGYEPQFTSAGIYQENGTDICVVGVLYDHNIEEMEELLKQCNVDMSIVKVVVSGRANDLLGYDPDPTDALESKKDEFHINEVTFIRPEGTSAVDVYRIDLSDTEKLADLADYISANYSDELFDSIVVSVNGSDYAFIR